MITEIKMPVFTFTPEELEQFRPWMDYVGTDGLITKGKHEGTKLSEMRTEHLHLSVTRLIANAIRMQQELDSRSKERLLHILARIPLPESTQLKLIQKWYWEYGIKLTPDNRNECCPQFAHMSDEELNGLAFSPPATVQPLCSPPTNEAHDNEIQIQVWHQ